MPVGALIVVVAAPPDWMIFVDLLELGSGVTELVPASTNWTGVPIRESTVGPTALSNEHPSCLKVTAALEIATEPNAVLEASIVPVASLTIPIEADEMSNTWAAVPVSMAYVVPDADEDANSTVQGVALVSSIAVVDADKIEPF